MNLGAFSISLTVADIAASRAFYEALGFEIVGGKQEENWLILRNGHATVGLFHGMFDKNMLTFNPGWDRENEAVESFTDVRELQAAMKEAGLELVQEVDASKPTGPNYLMLVDPDGNPILVDQHV